MADKLNPDQAVRVLRAVGGKLENQSRVEGLDVVFSILATDIALIAQLLADHIEENQTVRITGPEASGTKYAPPPGWLRDPHDTSASPGERWWDGKEFTHLTRSSANITREMLESRRPYVTKSGKVLTDADIEALADEAERGYDVSHLKEQAERNHPGDPRRGHGGELL